MTQTLNIGAVTSLALGVVFAFATPASAAMNSSAMVITNLNGGAIISGTTATANTGGNTAGGSRGGNGGSAGDVEAEDGNMNNGGAAAGNGGNGGNASAGGWVETGDADAEAGSINQLNSNDTDIEIADDMNSSGLIVTGASVGLIAEVTGAGANAGENSARGSRGGRGGQGGEVEADDTGSNNNGGATAGNGGNGGVGSTGGEVKTGKSTSAAGSLNVLNTNIVRVRM